MQEIHTRLDGIEGALEKITGLLETVSPFLSLIPGAAPVVGVAGAALNFANETIDRVEGDFDAAGAAAKRVSVSTGSDTLDARLFVIESFLEALTPLLSLAARHWGIELPVAFAAPATFVPETDETCFNVDPDKVA